MSTLYLKQNVEKLGIFRVLIILLLSFQPIQAQDWDGQSAEEQQRIRETRLLEWQAQEQAQFNQEQNTSYDQSYQEPANKVEPDREDFFNAASAGNVGALGQMLTQGFNINIANNERETALHMAAARGHFETVRFLVDKGANVNAVTVKRWIPLHHAVRFKHPNIVNFLIQHGSVTHARTSDGLSAVDMARNTNDYRLLSIMGAR